MDELSVLQEACKYPINERFVIEADCIDKLESMELVIFYDGVYWVTCEGESYAKNELC